MDFDEASMKLTFRAEFGTTSRRSMTDICVVGPACGKPVSSSHSV